MPKLKPLSIRVDRGNFSESRRLLRMDEIDDNFKNTFNDMILWCRRNKSKLLTASQIGDDRKYGVIFVRVEGDSRPYRFIRIINPEIVEASPVINDTCEFCLNEGNKALFRRRRSWLRLHYFDLKSRFREIVVSGVWMR